MKKTLINILGAGRSGTTMLDLMLGNNDNSFSMGEVRAWFRPFRKHHYQIDCNCGNKDCVYWNDIKNLKESEFFTVAFKEWNVDYLIDSSKNIPWMIDSHSWAMEQDIRVINFLIYKPIINYVYSVWKRGESINTAVYRYKLYYNRFFESGLDAYSINFKELVSNPTESLNYIVSITNQVNVENRDVFWNKEHHHLFGSGGVRKQTNKGDSKIKAKDDFSEEFLELIPELEKRIAQDFELSDISLKLGNIDYKTRNRNLEHNIKKPYWYYYLKLKNKYLSKNFMKFKN